MKLRRKVSFGLLIALAVLAGWAGLAWHSHYRAERALAELRLMGAQVQERHRPPDWWGRIAISVGVSPLRGPFVQTNTTVMLEGSAVTSDALRLAARHPSLTALVLVNAPDFDDDAFEAVRDLPTITGLYLTEVSVGDAGLRHLARLPMLRYVQVEDCRVTDEGVHFLCGLPSVEFVSCGGPGLKACTVHDLALTVLGGAATVKGRIAFTTPTQAGRAVMIRVVVIDELFGQSSRGTGIVAPDGSFSVVVAGKCGVQAGRYHVWLDITLPGKPSVNYRLPRVAFEVPER